VTAFVTADPAYSLASQMNQCVLAVVLRLAFASGRCRLPDS
jgi:hypothetical protein